MFQSPGTNICAGWSPVIPPHAALSRPPSDQPNDFHRRASKEPRNKYLCGPKPGYPASRRVKQAAVGANDFHRRAGKGRSLASIKLGNPGEVIPADPGAQTCRRTPMDLCGPR
ncbi:hypothetical protein Bbelb_296810 [Branchiostoma belcheri]|nr:hypothetical protein Bbelb_296810 [Branchiostoma belcheri]